MRTKTAALMAIEGIGPEEADALLRASGGSLRKAMIQI